MRRFNKYGFGVVPATTVINNYDNEWCICTMVTEYIAPGIRYIRDAKTGELLAFIEGEEDDDMTDEQEDD